jgi:hypothetical protein
MMQDSPGIDDIELTKLSQKSAIENRTALDPPVQIIRKEPVAHYRRAIDRLRAIIEWNDTPAQASRGQRT